MEINQAQAVEIIGSGERILTQDISKIISWKHKYHAHQVTDDHDAIHLYPHVNQDIYYYEDDNFR